MACQIIKNDNGTVKEVLASNGEPSILWDTLESLPFLTEEQRIDIYTNTQNVKKGVLDANGEPILVVEMNDTPSEVIADGITLSTDFFDTIERNTDKEFSIGYVSGNIENLNYVEGTRNQQIIKYSNQITGQNKNFEIDLEGERVFAINKPSDFKQLFTINPKGDPTTMSGFIINNIKKGKIKPTKVSESVQEEDTQEQTVTITEIDVNPNERAIVAVIGDKKIGSINLVPQGENYIVDTSNLREEYHGNYIGTSMYLEAIETMDRPIVSDMYRTEAAEKVWNRLVTDGYAERMADGRFISKRNADFLVVGEQGSENNKELLNNLKEAKALEKQGVNYKQIESKTGWYKVKGDWKTIPKEVVENFNIINIKTNKEQTLKEVIGEQNKIFEIYPQMVNTKVTFVDFTQGQPTFVPKDFGEFDLGLFDKEINHIFINENTEEGRQTLKSLTKILAHEVTHQVQEIENHPRGGDFTTLIRETLRLLNLKKDYNSTEDLIRDINQGLKNKNLNEQENRIVLNSIKILNYLDNPNSNDLMYDQYMMLFGEVDANIVEEIVSGEVEQRPYSELLEMFASKMATTYNNFYDIRFSRGLNLEGTKDQQTTIAVTKYLQSRGMPINILSQRDMNEEVKRRGYNTLSDTENQLKDKNEKVYGFYDNVSGNIYLTEELLNSNTLTHELWHWYHPILKKQALQGNKTAEAVLNKMTELADVFTGGLEGTRKIYESSQRIDVEQPVDFSIEENFNRWKGDNKLVQGTEVQEVKTGQPIVAIGFHGTTNEFYEFDSSVKGNIEGHLGKVNYFTTDFQDAFANYQADGADITGRIDRRSEEISYEIEYEYNNFDTDSDLKRFIEDKKLTFEDVSEVFGEKYSIVEAKYNSDNLAEIAAKKELLGGTEQVLDLYIKLNNPVVLGKGSTWFETLNVSEADLNIATEEIAEENDISIEEAKEDYYFDIQQRAIENTGYENLHIEALQDALRNNGYDSNLAFEILGDNFYETEIDLNQIEKDLRNAELYDNFEGELATNQVISDFFKNLGFDGIILTDVASRFRSMGLSSGTSHIHVFDEFNNQIKLADGSNVTFGETSDIRFQIVGEQQVKNLEQAENILNNKKVAEVMRISGKTPIEIKKATGWEFSETNNKWQYEYDDVQVKPQDVEVGKEYLISKLVTNTEPYTDLTLTILDEKEYNDNSTARYNTEAKRIEINGKFVSNAMDSNLNVTERKRLNSELSNTINHEIQHYNQAVSGFFGGGTLQTVVTEAARISGLNTNVDHNRETILNAVVNQLKTPNLDKQTIDILQAAEKILSTDSNALQVAEMIDSYNRLAGEVEARAVENRANLSPEQRLNSLLSETMNDDIREEDRLYVKSLLDTNNRTSGTQESSVYAPRPNETLEQYHNRRTDEAIARILGENSTEYFEKLAKENGLNEEQTKSFVEKVKQFIKDFSNWLKEQLGLTDITPEQVAQMTNKELFDAIITSMLEGDYVFDNNKRAQEYFTREADRLPLTLSVFQRPEFVKMQGKMVKPISVLNSLNQSGIKQIEKDLIKNIIEENYQGQKKISYDELEATVRANIMPLERIFTSSYADYGMDNLGDGNYGDANTIILNAPIEHGVTGHFSGDFKVSGRKNIKYIPKQLNDNTWVAVEEGYETQANNNNIYQFVGTAGTKESVDAWIENYEKPYEEITPSTEGIRYTVDKFYDGDYFVKIRGIVEFDTGSLPSEIKTEEEAVKEAFKRLNEHSLNYRYKQDINKGMFGHIRVWQNGDIFTVAEMQSDYFQKNNARKQITDKIGNPYRLSRKLQFLVDDNVDENLIKDIEYRVNNNNFSYEKTIKSYKETIKNLQEGIKNENEETKLKERYSKILKEQQEIIKILEKYEKLYKNYFPTEKLSPQEKQFIASQKEWEKRTVREAIKEASLSGARALRFPTPYTLSVIEGYVKPLDSENTPYQVVTASNNDFLVVGDTIRHAGDLYVVVDNSQGDIEVKRHDYGQTAGWEKEGLEIITDSPLVQNLITEVEIDGEQHEYLYTQGRLYVWETYSDGSLTFNQPKDYKAAEKEDFSIENDLSDTQQTVARKYEQIAEILKNERGEENVEIITDENGFDWYETKIEASETQNPVVAFQVIGEQGANNVVTEKNLLDQAKKLKEQGTPLQDIESKTGWLYIDNQWKKLSTNLINKFKVKPEAYEKINKPQKLSDVLEDQSLFDYYPNITEVQVYFYDEKLSIQGEKNSKFSDANTNGFFSNTIGEKGTIFINSAPEKKEGRGAVLAHEVTRLTEELEGFPVGGNIFDGESNSFVIRKKDGQNEVSSLKKGTTVTENPIELIKGTFGKRNIDGSIRTAHPNAQGIFTSVDEKVAERYADYKGANMVRYEIPSGTTIEVVNEQLKDKTLSQLRKDETDAINESQAQIVKLITFDSRGQEEQYIIKDYSLIPALNEALINLESPETLIEKMIQSGEITQNCRV